VRPRVCEPNLTQFLGLIREGYGFFLIKSYFSNKMS
jgi:hypothetical protein